MARGRGSLSCVQVWEARSREQRPLLSSGRKRGRQRARGAEGPAQVAVAQKATVELWQIPSGVAAPPEGLRLGRICPRQRPLCPWLLSQGQTFLVSGAFLEGRGQVGATSAPLNPAAGCHGPGPGPGLGVLLVVWPGLPWGQAPPTSAIASAGPRVQAWGQCHPGFHGPGQLCHTPAEWPWAGDSPLILVQVVVQERRAGSGFQAAFLPCPLRGRCAFMEGHQAAVGTSSSLGPPTRASVSSPAKRA